MTLGNWWRSSHAAMKFDNLSYLDNPYARTTSALKAGQAVQPGHFSIASWVMLINRRPADVLRTDLASLSDVNVRVAQHELHVL